MQTRLKDVKENFHSISAQYPRVKVAIGVLLTNTDDHIFFLKNHQLLIPEERERMIRIFTEFKLELLEFKYNCDIQAKDKEIYDLQEQNSRREELVDTLLRKKLDALQDHCRNTSSDFPTVVLINIMNHAKQLRSLVYNDAYPEYLELREEARNKFKLGSDEFDLTYAYAESSDILTISDEDDYRKALEDLNASKKNGSGMFTLNLFINTITQGNKAKEECTQIARSEIHSGDVKSNAAPEDLSPKEESTPHLTETAEEDSDEFSEYSTLDSQTNEPKISLNEKQ
ncbi:hypothetical protein EC973_001470 [Apophysomyces ossiformis]|uniref:PB1 domain-containing protein n=1 Tax=Apophysomyces ossiformis TaxID=679940 RepID=A0A8H7EN59_9FUNG|nr:hypothetical protein EC973_001470 [Apophysomyces ossiformis]